MKGIFPIEKFRNLQTPFYYYDTDLLRNTLNVINREAERYENFQVHYAVKANANAKILAVIRDSGMPDEERCHTPDLLLQPEYLS